MNPSEMSNTQLMRAWCDALAEMQDWMRLAPLSILVDDPGKDWLFEEMPRLLAEVQRRKLRPYGYYMQGGKR